MYWQIEYHLDCRVQRSRRSGYLHTSYRSYMATADVDQKKVGYIIDLLHRLDVGMTTNLVKRERLTYNRAIAASILRLYYSDYVLRATNRSYYYLILGFCL